MKHFSRFCFALIAIFVLANYSSEKTNVEGKSKNKINVYGTLETVQSDAMGNAKQYKVDNIAIGKVFEGIPVYAMPSPSDYTEKNGKMHFKKEINPAEKYVKTNIDLVTSGGKQETTEIRVDNPQKSWIYKKKKHSTPIEYAEIVIKSNDPAGTEAHYLINTKQKLTCDELNEAGPKEMEVPVQAIKRLTIEGYTHRDAPKGYEYKSEKPQQPTTQTERDELDITSEILEELPEQTRSGIGAFPQGHSSGPVVRETSLLPYQNY